MIDQPLSIYDNVFRNVCVTVCVLEKMATPSDSYCPQKENGTIHQQSTK